MLPVNLGNLLLRKIWFMSVRIGGSSIVCRRYLTQDFVHNAPYLYTKLFLYIIGRYLHFFTDRTMNMNLPSIYLYKSFYVQCRLYKSTVGNG